MKRNVLWLYLERKSYRETRTVWFNLRLWLLIESIICCGMCLIGLISLTGAHLSMMHSIHSSFCLPFFGFIDSHSHSILHHDASLYLPPFLSHQLVRCCNRRLDNKKELVGKIVNLKLHFLLVSWLTVKIQKPLKRTAKSAKKNIQFPHDVHTTQDSGQQRDNVHETTELFVFYYTRFFDVSEYDMEKLDHVDVIFWENFVSNLALVDTPSQQLWNAFCVHF